MQTTYIIIALIVALVICVGMLFTAASKMQRMETEMFDLYNDRNALEERNTKNLELVNQLTLEKAELTKHKDGTGAIISKLTTDNSDLTHRLAAVEASLQSALSHIALQEKLHAEERPTTPPTPPKPKKRPSSKKKK